MYANNLVVYANNLYVGYAHNPGGSSENRDGLSFRAKVR